MKVVKVILLSCLWSVFLCGCCSPRNLSGSVNTEQADSVRVEVVRDFVVDTVFVEIPAQTAERLTRDSVSRLENDFATSEARINPDGSLFHNLNTKPQKKPELIHKPVERCDSVIYQTRTVYKTEKEEIPHELTWFQKVQICGFWLLLTVVAINRLFRSVR